jgi:hypothetical protein
MVPKPSAEILKVMWGNKKIIKTLQPTTTKKPTAHLQAHIQLSNTHMTRFFIGEKEQQRVHSNAHA